MRPSSAFVRLMIAALLLAGCGELFLSKEQRQMNEAVRQAVTTQPSRINAPYADGEPPLHIALTHRLPKLLYWLLNRGADPNVRDEQGQTALHTAVIFGWSNHRALRELVKRGADVNSTRNDGGTPLHLAASLSRASPAEFLLEAGADPNARNRLGETPLHRASVPQPTASAEDAERTIRLLITGGGDVSAHSSNGETPLHFAALMGSVLATQTLLDEGAKVDAPGLVGRTALHVAATFAKPEVAEVLLQAGADPNYPDDLGRTPLRCALEHPAVTSKGERPGPVDTSEVVQVLRRFGAAE